MLLVLPATSGFRPTEYFAHSYDYYPSGGYYTYDDAPRYAAPSYPSHLAPFPRPSPEELEEREYQRALEVVVNHRRRQAEKEAAIRRQQAAEAARQRYLAVLAAELEQRRQAESLAARRAEFIRSQQARARLAAAERQHAISAYLQQFKGPQPIARQPHVVKREPLADALKKRLAAESDADITEPIKNILSALEPRPVEPEQCKAPSEGACNPIENLLSSTFRGLVFHTQPEPTPSVEQAQPSVPDKGKGKARAVDVEEPQKPETRSDSAEEAFADMLRHVMGLSKSTPAPRSPDEAGPSGSSLPSPAKPAITEGEQAQIDRAIALSSVEHIQNAFTKLQTDFVLPTELDHYSPSTDEHDETASVSSVSSSDLTKLIPYTHTNKPVYKYENELQGLLEELDRIDSHGDAGVREKRKAVVKAVEKALEGVENVVGEVVGKRLSLVSTATEAPEELLKGSNVDGDVPEEVVPAQEPVEGPVVLDNDAIPEQSTSVPAEETVISPAGVPSPFVGAAPEAETPTVAGTIAAADLPVEQTRPESDVEASTATITPDSVKPEVVTEAEPTGSQVQSDPSEVADTFLLPEKVSPPSPIQKPQQIDSDAEDEVLSLDSDAEKSEWSEVEQ